MESSPPLDPVSRPPDYSAPLWDASTVRRAIGDVGVGTFFEIRKRHGFPRPLRIGDRRIAWRREDVLGWIARRAAA
jgi:predicted DNA-binding transcriptional regulator AlpA